MEFKNSIVDIVKERISTRTYDGRALEEKHLDMLNAYLDEINKEIKIKARFKIISNLGVGKEESKKLGTYGFIQGANTYVVGILDKSDNDALEFGYIFEKIILFATDLGVQTCWLGGTFSKENFKELSGLNDDEFLPIVSPLGYKKDKMRLFETTLRASVGADNKKPWSDLFFDKNMLPLNEADAGDYATALEMVRLGPSASNKQPWRIVKDDDVFHFFIKRNKGYGVPGYDIQMNDIGIAKCHFDLTVKELNLSGSWQALKNVNTPEDFEYVISWVSSSIMS